MKRYAQITLFVSAFLCIGLLHADAALLKKKSAQVFIQNMVDKHGFKREAVVEALKKSEFKPRIIELMNTPYEKKSWDVYQAIFLTQKKLEGGLKFWHDNQESLAEAEKKYGVPASVIVAILGVETLYGEKQGTYRVLDALSTIAFYYPKRGAYFTRELEEYLLLCRAHQVPVTEYTGSYAGAIGQPQFMPSSYRMYAVDFKKTGNNTHPDLVRENKDSIASIANYFKRHGWVLGEDVAEPVKLKGKQYKTLKTNTRKANYTYSYLLKSGVEPTAALKKPPNRAGLIALDMKDDSHVYWLAFPNFYVTMRYNTSPQYALVVHLLSQQLKERFEAEKT
ncbi:MAG: lytic murein transglycosylase B [Gammaproteobacteria bacterium]|nr:lytic murein transglycosylase B [Gammaproteobacteria bacterium]MCH9763669.1 lytic murein transglycosylase B [Gammaproteobacteria bacterium]